MEKLEKTEINPDIKNDEILLQEKINELCSREVMNIIINSLIYGLEQDIKSYDEEILEGMKSDSSFLFESEEKEDVSEHEATMKFRTPAVSLENQMITNQFLADYYQALESLDSLEKKILLLWFDCEGRHSYSAQEIGSILGISKSKVYKVKTKALKRLAENETIIGYKD